MSHLKDLSDEELERRLEALVKEESERTLAVIEHLAELYRRHLATKRGYSGLFHYCTTKLKYTPDQAMRRITVARASVKFEKVGEKLREGELTISAVRALAPALATETQAELVAKAQGLSVRDIEKLVASIAPCHDKRDTIRISSAPPTNGALDDLPLFARADAQEARFTFGFSAGESLKLNLDRAKQLLWHKFPEGRLEDIIGQALDDLLDKRDPDRRQETRRPKIDDAADAQRRRYIPVWIRAEVWKRDGGCCAYTTSDGVRCGERSALEYDHVIPWALGGPSDEPDNIRLLCRAHNQLLARQTFGETAAGRPAS
jgi:5-methylcytosine-specific restriction endonuclease McrA